MVFPQARFQASAAPQFPPLSGLNRVHLSQHSRLASGPPPHQFTFKTGRSSIFLVSPAIILTRIPLAISEGIRMIDHAASSSSEGWDYLPGASTAERRSLVRWYAAARAALAHNRPLTTATSPHGSRRGAAELSTAELTALQGVGAFKDDLPIGADSDPLLHSQAQYMALLEESLSAAEAAKLLRVDVTRVRQRLRERSLYGLEYEGTWRLPRFQFERRLVIPGLAQVLKALPPDLFPLDVIDWFLQPEPDLQHESDAAPLSPRTWLLSGRPIDAVVKLASDLTRT